MWDNFAFRRPTLAQAYCDSLDGKGMINATSGLFLAGPRRVGKSTFLIEDLIPEANTRNWVVVYVDLWANKQADPSSLIIEAIKKSMSKYKSKLSKLAAQVKLEKMNILKVFELDFTKPGLPEHVTLVDLLNGLAQVTNKPVLLIIDEAQHALSSTHGINAMFAIKSARDQINLANPSPILKLVLTGSNRDKLAQLVLKKDQPFFGSEITSFPLLGHDFTDVFTETVNQALNSKNQFSKEAVWEAFQLMGHRPEILRQVVAQTAINHESNNFSELLKQDASIWQGQMWREFENDFNSLTPIQRAVLILLIKEGRLFAPFSESSMSWYKKHTSQHELSISTVQAAIHSLRDLGFIWQSGRGAYALEDESFAIWFKHVHQNINW